ncbi:MAG: PD-(D/E)XK nuclease family protein [candidate division WOR-3 bacterium]
MLDSGIKPEEILYLTPSPRKLRATQVLLTRILGRRAFIPPMFRTLGQLAREICDHTSAYRFLHDELKPVLIRRIAQQRGREVTLGYAQVVGGFIADVKRHVASEVEQNIPEILNKLLAGYDKPLRRALEAYELMLEYNRLLKTHGWFDREDLIREAVECLDEFSELPPVLILDCFVAPNRLEQQLLAQLVDRCPMVIAGTYWSDAAPEKYTLARRFIDFIDRQAGFIIERLTGEQKAREPEQLYRFPSPDQEIIGVCREICKHSAELNPADTYVVFPRLGYYVPLVERYFPQYRIPYSVFPSSPLISSPVITPVLELLKALDSDYERVAAAAVFSSPYFPGLLRLPGENGLDARNRAAALINIASRRAGIIKGRDNWLNIAERILNDEEQLENGLKAELLHDLQIRIRQAIGLTESILEPAGTLGNQARRLRQFLEVVEFGSNLETTTEWFEELNQDRKSLYDLLDTLSELEIEFGEQPEPRRQFIRSLLHLLGTGTKSPERDHGGVMVVAMEEMLGINPANLFFCGLTETELPGPYHPDPILPDSVRRELGMPDIEWHREWQRFHFWQVLNSSPRTPFCSFAESRDGRPELPTPFIELEPVRYVDQRDIIFSDVEELLYIGKNKRSLLEEFHSGVDFSANETVKKALGDRFGPHYCFHVTMLENYRYCPFQFYLQHVLGLNLPEEPIFELDARSWGTVAHQLLARLYQKGAVPLELIPERAQKITGEILPNLKLPEFWHQVTERVLNNLIVEFVKTETRLREAGFLPERTELRLRGTVDGISLQGRLDRLDRRDGQVRIIDYKTGSGSISASDVIHKKSHIQLPIYAHLLLQSPEFGDLTVENMGIYNLRSMNLNLLVKEGHPDVMELIKAARENTVDIVQKIRAGIFLPAEVDKNHCRECEYRFTCGRDHDTYEQE